MESLFWKWQKQQNNEKKSTTKYQNQLNNTPTDSST
jgi:hypothetical protein